MTALQSIFLSFSMFSRLPVPRVEWSEKNMRYMLCAFPLVGVVIGAIVAVVCLALEELTMTIAMGAASGESGTMVSVLRHLLPLVLVLIPVAVTGGIHVDGFMDTCDALGSHADREKKLAIMKDSHCGAFSVIGCVLYFLVDFVLLSEFCRVFFMEEHAGSFSDGNCIRLLACFSLSFVISRLLSAFSVATFPIAKDSGLVRTFADASAKRFTAAWCAICFMLLSGLLVWFCRAHGAGILAAQLVVFGVYFVMTKRNFGGITGDTAGWFVQMSELMSVLALVLTAMLLF